MDDRVTQNEEIPFRTQIINKKVEIASRETTPAGCFISKLKNEYKKYTLRATRSKFVRSSYNPIREWLNEFWPCEVGRYYFENCQIDVIFGDEPCDSNEELRRCPTNEKWTDEEYHEWTKSDSGNWTDWSYDINSSSVATVAMKLLEDIPPKERTPHRIVRHFTSLCNESNSEFGLIYGMWDPSRFSEGYHPSHWKSSSHILDEYLKNEKPVKFGQCWIFAEVLVSLFRYLNIPSRSLFIENARSDKGKDGGIDIGFAKKKGRDEYYEYEDYNLNPILDLVNISEDDIGVINSEIADQDIIEVLEVVCKSGEIISPTDCDLRSYVQNGDDMWNFHLFTEVYIPRPDIGKESCWNCLDASPLTETASKDSYQGQKVLGPCPSDALLNNETVVHDFNYFNSSINALYRFWKEQGIVDNKGRHVKIIYPSNIVYGCLTRNCDKRQSKIFIRDPEKSNISLRKDISDQYKPIVEDAYAIYHKFHPFTISVIENKIHISIVNNISSKSVIQVCYLDSKDRILLCDKHIISKIEDYSFPEIVKKTSKISVVLVNTTTRVWWAWVCSN